MIAPMALGGIRTVVENYIDDRIIKNGNFKFVSTYENSNFLLRQLIFFQSLSIILYYCIFFNVTLAHIHVAMYGSFFRKMFITIILRTFSVPYILHLHGSQLKEFFNSVPLLIRSYLIYELQKASCVIVLSENWKSYIEGLSHKINLSIIRNYISIPNDVKLKQLSGIHRILFLGDLGPRKGVLDLVRAFRFVVNDNPNCYLTVCGAGDSAPLKNLISSLDLSRSIEFLGWIEKETRDFLLERADILVLPSYNEALPMSLLESMAYGVVPISTPVGGIPDLIKSGHNGLLVGPGDIEGLVRAINLILRDGELFKTLSKNAILTVSMNYSKEIVVKEIFKIYNRYSKI